MKVRSSAGPVLSAIAIALAAVPLAASAQDAQAGHGQPEPPMMGIHWAKGHAGNPHGGGSPNLLWHGGDIMTSAVVSTIFWGPSWNNAGFVGDKISGLATFYSTMKNTGYAATTNEYNANNGFVTSNIALDTNYLDFSAAPSRAPKTSEILNEVCKVVTNPVANGYYAVYVDTPRGHAGYCAWHSASSCNGVPVQFAFFFNLDGDPGCDPEDGSGLHSQGLAALANVSGHELSEARTDPRLNAWYDSSGAENSDKCAWAFGTPLLTFASNSKWKIQGNWSNAHYNNSTGYPNNSGQSGCIDGGNYK